MINRKLVFAALTGALVVATGWPAATHAEDALTREQKAAVEKLVERYILDHPEIITRAMEKLREQQRKLQAEAERQALRTYKAALTNDPESPVGGNPSGDVVMVEFFDYRCGVCKRVSPVIKELLAKDRKIRLIYKEWPILGPDSVRAAKAALASRGQGKYAVFHDELMKNKGALDEKSLMAIARKVGLDTDRLRRDMKDPRLDRLVKRNYALAEALNINGTPSFVIGDTVVRGARDFQTMQALVEKARKTRASTD